MSKRGKGPKGETCSDAIEQAVKSLKIASARDIFNWVRQKYFGCWTDDHIWQDIMASTVNLVPAHEHWVNAKRFLFLHEDGRFELYDPKIHGQYSWGAK